jgi:hypothetical protein
MSDAAQFFTWTSLTTLAGATGATYVVTNTLKSAFDYSPRWLGLLIAQIICIGTAAYVAVPAGDCIIAILNGCLVYLSAAGTSSAGAVITGQAAQAPVGGEGKPAAKLATQGKSKPFFAAWY